ncbi:MAG: hypothetical protein ACP5KA_00805 [Desulfurococcaceae archaeon]
MPSILTDSAQTPPPRCHELRLKAIVYRGRLEVVDYPAVPASEDLLVKPLYVYVGDVENAIIKGTLPLVKPVILGSVGVVKVIEVLEGWTEYTGKTYSVTPIGSIGILGVHLNGLLTSYVSIPRSYIDEELPQPTPLDSIKPLAKHAGEIATISEEPVLVEGCGILGILVGLLLRRAGIEPVYYCEERAGRASALGFNVHSNVGSLGTKWRTIILTSTSASSKYALLWGLEYSHVVISPLSFTKWVPLPLSKVESFKLSVVTRAEHYNAEHVRSVLKDVARNIKVISVDDVEKALGLLPTRGLGTVIALKG